jgi:membrane fusion protein, adhesin transport system
MLKLRQPTVIVAITAFALIGFVAWSLWAEIDQVTRAPGQVIPSGRTQIVQSQDGGTISEILVREGERVRKGQLLVRLDEVRLRAAVDESLALVAAQRAKMARIEAELFNRPLVFPREVEGHPEFAANQRQLYLRRREALRSNIASLTTMMNLAQQELSMNMPLLESGDVSRSEVLRMQRGVADLQGQISAQRNSYLRDLQADYAATEEELATSEQQLTQRRSALAGAELRSPADGVVVNIRVTTIGGVLGPGDEVLQVVPSADTLIVEARVAPSEIAFVRVGQPAAIKFDAYDSSIYGAADGRVSYVSADTITEQTPQGAVSFYRVRLTADTSRLRPRPGEQIALQPGMTARAEIVTGHSTVFRYLTKPIIGTASDSLGER